MGTPSTPSAPPPSKAERDANKTANQQKEAALAVIHQGIFAESQGMRGSAALMGNYLGATPWLAGPHTGGIPLAPGNPRNPRNPWQPGGGYTGQGPKGDRDYNAPKGPGQGPRGDRGPEGDLPLRPGTGPGQGERPLVPKGTLPGIETAAGVNPARKIFGFDPLPVAAPAKPTVTPSQAATFKALTGNDPARAVQGVRTASAPPTVQTPTQARVAAQLGVAPTPVAAAAPAAAVQPGLGAATSLFKPATVGAGGGITNAPNTGGSAALVKLGGQTVTGGGTMPLASPGAPLSGAPKGDRYFQPATMPRSGSLFTAFRGR